MDGGRPGRSVVLRADIDALPVQEDEARACHSEVEGVMHACGHDVHVAALLGAASVLASRREDLPGRYVFLFQPGEEALCGAKADDRERRAHRHGGLAPRRVPRDLADPHRAWWPCAAASTMSEAHSLRITLTGPGRPRRHAHRPGRRHPGHGRARRPAGRGGRRAVATREPTASAARARCRPAPRSTSCRPRPGSPGTLRTFTDAQREEALARLRRPVRLRSPTTRASRSTWSCPNTRRRW